METGCKKYLNAVKKELNCSCKSKKEIIENIESSIYDNFENIQNVTFEEIAEKLGSPKEIANNFYETNNECLKKKNKILTFVQVGLAICLIASLLVVIYLSQKSGITDYVSSIENGSVRLIINK